MGASKRIKRRLLKELVDQNVALIRGDLPKPRAARRVGRWPGAVIALALLGLATGALLVAAGQPGPSAGASPLAAPATAAAPAPPASGEAVLSATSPRSDIPTERVRPETPRFAPPAPLDGNALPLSVRRIVLDPGHGGEQPGARGPLGLVEKEVALDLGLRLHDLLEDAGFEVVLTRETDDSVSLAERARRANDAQGDLFVSIHLNWIANRGVRGVETYYLGATDDPYLTELAAKENRGSGLALSELRPLLDDIYLDVRHDKSKQLAQAVQTALHRSLSQINPELSDRGIKTAPFIVLAKTEMPAILAEVSCLSNRREAELLTRPLYRQFIAEALFAGLEAYARPPEDSA